MNGLEKSIVTLNRWSYVKYPPAVDVRMQLLVTIVYIVAVLSVPIEDPARLIWFLCFPIVMAEALHIGYGKIFVSSLCFLPLILFIGILNPLIDRQPLWHVGDFVISRGWVTFACVEIRGILTIQALLILIRSCGFNDMCSAFSNFGMPRVLVTQLLMLYRFMTVILEEALTMHRARQSRGFGRKSYPLRMWGTFAGQLLLRSIDRAKRVNRAMIARGFNGALFRNRASRKLRATDWIYLAAWLVIIAAARFIDLTSIAAEYLSKLS